MILDTLEISVDLDSTLADTRHRRGIIEQYTDAGLPVDWDVYAKACIDDPLTSFAHLLLRMQDVMEDRLRWHVVSGRSDGAYPATREWLVRHGFRPYSVNLEDGDSEGHSTLGHALWKARRVIQVAETYPGISIHVDDWAEVADQLEKLTGGRIRGFTVLPPGMAAAHRDNPL